MCVLLLGDNKNSGRVSSNHIHSTTRLFFFLSLLLTRTSLELSLRHLLSGILLGSPPLPSSPRTTGPPDFSSGVSEQEWSSPGASGAFPGPDRHTAVSANVFSPSAPLLMGRNRLRLKVQVNRQQVSQSQDPSFLPLQQI